MIRFRDPKWNDLSVMEDAGGRKKRSAWLTQSRKQDRKDGLLGWWVSVVLILPAMAWKPAWSAPSQPGPKGPAEGYERERRGALPSQDRRVPSPNSLPNSLKDESSPRRPPTSWSTSPARQVPVIDRSKVDPTLLKSAEGMEAMFLDYMLKVMRQSVPRNEMDLESPATQIYRGMLDSEIAQKSARQGGIGLADQIIAYMQSRGYNQSQGHGVPKKEKP